MIKTILIGKQLTSQRCYINSNIPKEEEQSVEWNNGFIIPFHRSELDIISLILYLCTLIEQKFQGIIRNHMYTIFLPSHFNPCLTKPNSISPQKSQKVGVL